MPGQCRFGSQGSRRVAAQCVRMHDGAESPSRTTEASTVCSDR